jgi:hypothetical protein
MTGPEEEEEEDNDYKAENNTEFRGRVVRNSLGFLWFKSWPGDRLS